MRRAAFIAALCCVCLAPLAHAGRAQADVFGGISLASSRDVQIGGSELSEQAEGAKEPVISADGRYLAFVGSFGGVRGIWRRDLETGAVEQVAPANAILPSISEDGQYVSFTTTARLEPDEDRNSAPDVYVRDMAKPCAGEGGDCVACPEPQEAAEAEACPFVLVSAVSGSDEGASYQYTNPGEEEVRYGSLASGRSAMSANGEYVVFETAAESNLLGGPTPAREILLRNLATEETMLVSSEYDPQTGTDTGVPVPMSEGVGAAWQVPDFAHSAYGGASISADGTTVAWMGQDIGMQARLLPGEQITYLPQYNEPLWRRVNEGPTAPTRRVTGGSEPENPLCVASGESQLPFTRSLTDPCQGPFAVLSQPEFFLLDATDGNFVPQLSENGETVAFLASAREVAAGQEIPGSEGDDDLYVSKMSGGLTRVQALRRLTEIAGDVAKAELAAPIVDLAISPDGSQVAFTTQRTEFPLGSSSYVSAVAARAGIKELFDVDLSNETLTRVTHGYSGEATASEVAGQSIAAEEGATSPSFSKSGNSLSFASSADNLAYGDGNDASDAFLVTRLQFANSAPAQEISSPPPAPALTSPWRMYVTAASRPNGTVVLAVSVPGAGQLRAGASAAMRARVAFRRGAPKLLTRSVATARASVPAGTDGLQKLTVALASPYRSLARRAEGLYATVAVSFLAPGHQVLRASVHVRFRLVRPRRPARAAGRSASRR